MHWAGTEMYGLHVGSGWLAGWMARVVEWGKTKTGRGKTISDMDTLLYHRTMESWIRNDAVCAAGEMARGTVGDAGGVALLDGRAGPVRLPCYEGEPGTIYYVEVKLVDVACTRPMVR
jgi:hypothetical protein